MLLPGQTSICFAQVSMGADLGKDGQHIPLLLTRQDSRQQGLHTAADSLVTTSDRLDLGQHSLQELKPILHVEREKLPSRAGLRTDMDDNYGRQNGLQL